MVENSHEQPIERSNHRNAIFSTALVAAAGVMLAFEQSPLNEAIRADLAFDVLEKTDNALLVGTVVAGVTLAIEGISSGLITAGLHQKGETIEKLKKKWTKNETPQIKERKNNRLAESIGNIALALGVGAGIVTMKKHVRDDSPSLAKDIKTSSYASSVVAGVSGVVGWLVAGGIKNIDKLGVDFLTRGAEKFAEYGTNSLFWLGLFGTGYGIGKVKKRLTGRKSNMVS